jgi:hypothetical protein
MIIMWYFAFTTLSTVGYGDYHPRSDRERVLGGFIMLFGVAVFSFIMGNFTEILVEYRLAVATNDDNDGLTNWMTFLARFNQNGKPLPKSLTKRIEQHFDYFWHNDRQQAFR